MKRYIRATSSDDIREQVGDYACIIHPDKTVDCFKFWVRDSKDEAIYPNRTVKKVLRDKYGKDLIFMDDLEKNTPISSIEDAQQIVLNSNVCLENGSYYGRDEDIRRLKAWLIDANSVGSKTIGRIDTSRTTPTSTDFRNVIGVNQDLFISAIKMLHPGKSVRLTSIHKNRDPYAHKGIYAEPAKTYWKIIIE